jgi:hypothetical protein
LILRVKRNGKMSEKQTGAFVHICTRTYIFVLYMQGDGALREENTYTCIVAGAHMGHLSGKPVSRGRGPLFNFSYRTLFT